MKGSDEVNPVPGNLQRKACLPSGRGPIAVNPVMMQMMMGNMMNTVATDTAMTDYMIKMMENNPKMQQMMVQHYNAIHSGSVSLNSNIAHHEKKNK